jgi:hypothetical protein
MEFLKPIKHLFFHAKMTMVRMDKYIPCVETLKPSESKDLAILGAP